MACFNNLLTRVYQDHLLANLLMTFQFLNQRQAKGALTILILNELKYCVALNQHFLVKVQ